MNEVARRQGVQGVVERDLDALFHELESLSCGEESGQDIDSISIGSTPKPSLRPFFNSKKDNNSGECETFDSNGRVHLQACVDLLHCKH